MKPDFVKICRRSLCSCAFLAALSILFSCGTTDQKTNSNSDTLIKDTVKFKPISLLEKKLDSLGLFDVHAMDTNIIIDLKYSTADNFMGFDMYGDFDKAYLQEEVAEKLISAQNNLSKIKPGCRLIIFDAVRPRSVQQRMWDSLKMPESQKPLFVANPVTGSLHNYGCAVDVSILDDKGKELDMGTPYDFSGDAAWPSKETEMHAQNRIAQNQIDNRILLRKVMNEAGFTGIKTEWWHFDGCSLLEAKSRYKIVE